MKEMYFNFLVVFFSQILSLKPKRTVFSISIFWSFHFQFFLWWAVLCNTINQFQKNYRNDLSILFGMNLHTWYVFWWWVWAMFWNSVSIIVWLLHLFVLWDWFFKNKIKYWWKLRKRRFGLRMESLKVEYFKNCKLIFFKKKVLVLVIKKMLHHIIM